MVSDGVFTAIPLDDYERVGEPQRKFPSGNNDSIAAVCRKQRFSANFGLDKCLIS